MDFLAYLVFKRRTYPKVHKIVELAALCKVDWLDEYSNGLKLVDAYYVPIRYLGGIPGSLPDKMPGRREAEEAIEWAEKVLGVIKKHIHAA